MVRIYGVSADQLEKLHSLVSDAAEDESGLYVVQLWGNVRFYYSFDVVQISDGEATVNLDSLDFEKIVIS